MFRLWGKIFRDGHLLRDTEIQNTDYRMTRTEMVLDGVDQICRRFDLAVPIWLEHTVRDFQRHSRARFTQDNFIEEIDFDYLEIQVIEE